MRRDFLTETAAGLGAATAGLRLAGGDEKAGRPGREALIGLRLNSDVPEIGSFSCSNDLLIRVQEMCRGTFLSNIFSVQSDYPHRERFGYGGDLVATSDTVLLNFDMANFYAKAALDWQDAARPDGMLTDTAPFVGIQYCGLACAMAHPVIQSQLLRYVGDRRLIEQQYETTRRWLELVARENPDFIVREGLADHESLETTGVPFLVTPLYFQTAETASRLAGTLGRREDEARWAGLAASIRKAYLQSVLPPGPGRYASATQAAMAMALVPDLLPETEKGPAFEALLAKTVSPEGPRLMNSIFGTKWLLEALSAGGRADVAYDLVNRSSFPGWGYMLEKGATTLWEHWAFSDDTFSHNHPMFGSVTEWFVKWLAGIQPAQDAVGFDRILIRPQPVAGLTWVKAGVRSVRGEIRSKWRREPGRFLLDVTVPANTTATVHVPAGTVADVREGGRPAPEGAGVRFIGVEQGAALFEVGGGRYHFESRTPATGAETSAGMRRGS